MHAVLLESMLREGQTLDQAGWVMWCIGLPVTDGVRLILQTLLEKASDRVDETMASAAAGDAHHEPEEKPEEARSVHDMRVAIQVVHDIVLGIFEQGDYDLQTVRRAFDAEDLSASELGEMFTNVSRTVGLSAIERAINGAASDDLELWRNEIQTVSAYLSGGGPSSTPRLPPWTYVQWVGLRVAGHPMAEALLKALEVLGHPEGWDPPLIQIVRKHPGYTPDLGI